MSLFGKFMLSEDVAEEKLMNNVAQHALGADHSIKRSGNEFHIVNKDGQVKGKIRKATDTKYQISTDSGRKWNDIELDEEKLVSESDEKEFDEIVIKVRNDSNSLVKMLRHIKRIGDVSHSFNVVVDPQGDKDENKTFGWDGDGSDKIESIMINGSME